MLRKRLTYCIYYFLFNWRYRVNEVIEKKNIKIENMIYKIRGVQVIFDVEISATKCHDYIYDNIV